MTGSLYETAYFSVLLLASACIPSDAHDVDQPPRVCWPFILFSGGFCPPLPQSVFCIYEVCVCCKDSTHKGDHKLFVFL